MHILLKKLWINVRPNAVYVCLSAAVIVLGYLLLRREHADFIDNVKRMQATHDETVRKIVAAHEAERLAHEANLKKMEETLNFIQRKYDEDIRLLEVNKTKTVKKLVDQFDGDPEGVAKQISGLTGRQYAPAPTEK